MKKIFILAGELSGDKLAAWYLARRRAQKDVLEVTAVGGDFLQTQNVQFYGRMEELNCVGIVEIVKKIPFLLQYMTRLLNHLIKEQYDEIILVDFPGFNLRLLKKIKKLLPTCIVTYLAPPQLWVWGAWRLKTLKKCDAIVVLYPFEVSWYQKRGLTVHWYGYPFLEQILEVAKEVVPKKPAIALIVGSRVTELSFLIPLYATIIKQLIVTLPDVTFVIPRAETISCDLLEASLSRAGLSNLRSRITIIDGDHTQKYRALKECIIALSKPGTVTLELALLGIPTIVLYKTSWLTYNIAKSLVSIRCMALPNLFLPAPVFPEFLQGNCTPGKIVPASCALYQAYLTHDPVYSQVCTQLLAIKQVLTDQNSH